MRSDAIYCSTACQRKVNGQRRYRRQQQGKHGIYKHPRRQDIEYFHLNPNVRSYLAAFETYVAAKEQGHEQLRDQALRLMHDFAVPLTNELKLHSNRSHRLPAVVLVDMTPAIELYRRNES